MSKPLLEVRNLQCNYQTASGQTLQAVANVSFDVFEGETLGLVGESGCGKSTISKAIVRIIEATGGEVLFEGKDLLQLNKKDLRESRRQLQMVFQDPIASLNPRRACGEIVAEPLRIMGGYSEAEIREKVSTALQIVGFDPEQVWNRKPHQFSGGQCQRISLARAIISEPRFLICDEPVSALDVSVQAQILNLLDDMKERYGLTMIFISHDLSVIRQMSDRIAVMYLGTLCELASADALFNQPAHPYTAALLDCVPRIDEPLDYEDGSNVLSGEIPSPLNPPNGCRFRTRCPHAQARCADEVPILRQISTGQRVACHYPLIDGEADELIAASS